MQLASVLAAPLPAFVPIALWVQWKTKKGKLTEADLQRTALVTPSIIWLLGALVMIIVSHSAVGGVIIAVTIIFFGYIYVSAIELVRALGSRSGWLISERRSGDS